MALNYTQSQVVAKLKESRDNLLAELALHTSRRLDGAERVNYSLNGRTFDWLGYFQELKKSINDLNEAIAANEVAISIGVLR